MCSGRTMRKRQRKLAASVALFVMGVVTVTSLLTKLVDSDMYQQSVETTYSATEDPSLGRYVGKVIYNALTNDHPKLHASYPSLPPNVSEHDAIHVGMIVKHVNTNEKLLSDFKRCTTSILQHATTLPLHFILFTDEYSVAALNSVLRNLARVRSRVPVSVDYLDIHAITRNFSDVILTMKRHFLSSTSKSKYFDDLFHIGPLYHRMLPFSKLIVIDADLKFRTDIGDLFRQFQAFNDSHLMALAPDLSPMYRNSFLSYRSRHPGTPVGEPWPGLQGLNSGVVLFHLEHMRRSMAYNSLLEEAQLHDLCEKYEFVGSLGDQDFFTLMSMEHPDWVYPLDCSWNVQLDLQYSSLPLFSIYHNCSSEAKIHHGNAGYPIPPD